MRLENIVIDAHDPPLLGAFWEVALSAERLTWTDDLVEMRLHLQGGPTPFDVCLPRVAGTTRAERRVHLDLSGAGESERVVARLLDLGATRLDIGQGDVPWTVLADPEGNPFCVRDVRDSRDENADTGPIASLPIDSADPGRDAAFWSALTGWVPTPGPTPSLRHASGRGPRLEFWPQPGPKTGKNAVHLDVRPEREPADEALVRALDLGATRVDHDWGELPWIVLQDPSGNEFCLLSPDD